MSNYDETKYLTFRNIYSMIRNEAFDLLPKATKQKSSNTIIPDLGITIQMDASNYPLKIDLALAHGSKNKYLSF